MSRGVPVLVNLFAARFTALYILAKPSGVLGSTSTKSLYSLFLLFNPHDLRVAAIAGSSVVRTVGSGISPDASALLGPTVQDPSSSFVGL